MKDKLIELYNLMFSPHPIYSFALPAWPLWASVFATLGYRT